jgi:MYXO-CTERM domain-containing protein
MRKLFFLRALAALVLASSFFVPAPASAANILFVSDAGNETAIASVLMGDGHSVTSMPMDYASGNATLLGDLSSYDCVVWAATGNIFGGGTSHNPAVFTNLSDYVSSGGHVFVTGYGSISNFDAGLINFLGATGGTGFSGNPGMVADVDTDLTNGMMDIRNVTPIAWDSEYEGLSGFGADTMVIVNGTSGGAQWTLRTLGAGEIAWVAAGVAFSMGSSSGGWSLPGGGAAGAYNAALRNFASATDGTAMGDGPRIAFMGPPSANEGDEVTISVMVTDTTGATVTWSWDLDGDGTFGDHANEASITIPAHTTTAGDVLHIGVQATNGTGTSMRTRTLRIANVAPMITSSPPTTAAIGQHIRYRVVATDPGAMTTLTFSLDTGPSSAALMGDTFDWIPTEGEVTPAGTTRRCQITVNDGHMGSDTQTWEMRVLHDHAPSDPALLFPTLDVALLAPDVHLTVGNASDIDGDTLTYFFEIDSVATFDSPNLQRSGMQTAGTGTTTWTPDTAALMNHYGRWYWRASASDGQATTVPLQASFWVVPDPSMIPDAGPADASAGDAAVITPSTHNSCNCAAPGAGARSPLGAGLLALGLALVAARRRR